MKDERPKTERVGRFRIDDLLMYDNPALCKQLLASMIPIRCESLHVYRAIEYMAYGDMFDELEHPYAIVPFYEPIVTRITPHSFTIEWRRVGEDAPITKRL